MALTHDKGYMPYTKTFQTFTPTTMSEDTLFDLRCYVSNCFNANHNVSDDPFERKSGYQLLSALMRDEYDLTHNDVDNVVGDIEELVAQYIMEQSPKFYDNEEH